MPQSTPRGLNAQHLAAAVVVVANDREVAGGGKEGRRLGMAIEYFFIVLRSQDSKLSSEGLVAGLVTIYIVFSISGRDFLRNTTFTRPVTKMLNLFCLSLHSIHYYHPPILHAPCINEPTLRLRRGHKKPTVWHCMAFGTGKAGGCHIYNVSTEGGVGPRHRTQLTDLGGWGGRVQNSHNVVDFIYGRPPRCKLDYQVL